MIRASERRKKRRKARRSRSKGALAASPRESMARCIPSLESGHRTSSAQLVLADERAARLDEANDRVGVAPAMRLDLDERLPEIARAFRVYEHAGTTASTRRLYLNRLTLFASWCAARGARVMPADPEVLRLYVLSLADENKALSTLDVSMAAITLAHRALGHDPPMSDELRVTLRSLRRTLGEPRARSTSISLALLRQIIAPCEQDPHGIRDRALILVTYFAGLRRAEAAGLNREGVHREERGYRLTLDSAQRDPTDAPPLLTSHAEQNLCPVLALNAWLDARALRARGGALSATHGPVFVALRRGGPHRFHLGDRLAPTDVDRIVKRRAVAAGLNPAGLSAVSLRAGFSAEATRGGTSSAA
jgi:integrase